MHLTHDVVSILLFLTARHCISMHKVSVIQAVAAIKLEHAAEIAAMDEQQEEEIRAKDWQQNKQIRAKDWQMVANKKKLRKKHAAAAKAHGKEVRALQKALEVSANMITLSSTKLYSPLTLL